MKLFLFLLVLIGGCTRTAKDSAALQSGGAVPADHPPVSAPAPLPAPVSAARDYGLLFWRDGSRGRDESGRRLLCVQTGYFGAVFDVEAGRLLRLGRIEDAPGYAVAAAGYNQWVDTLPEVDTGLSLTVNGTVYRNRGMPNRWEVNQARRPFPIESGLSEQNSRNNRRYPVRIRDYGRYRQMFEMDHLRFESDDGRVLDAAVRLVMTSWPDVLRLRLELVPRHDLVDVSGRIHVAGADAAHFGGGSADRITGGTRYAFDLRIPFGRDPVESPETLQIEAVDLATDSPLTVSFDSVEDAWRVQLNNHPYDKQRVNGLDRYRLRFKNAGDEPRKIRIVFANEMGYHERDLPPDQQGKKRVESTMGALMMLRDSEGYPVGTPLQNAKNWTHYGFFSDGNTVGLEPWVELDPVEYGSWHRFSTVIELPPQSVWTGEGVVSHALWGGIPQASYYTLNLYSWGFYTFWDVAIQGSFGESVCYALEGYGPSDITDLRPLYVASYDSRRRPPFEWTPNLGGANYLHYKSKESGGMKQYLNTRREIPVSGPNLSRTVFHGRTEDEKIAFEITAMHPRTDDLNRSYHRIRYTVLEDTAFTRLAFFQLGTSLYDYYRPGKLAWGDRSGLQEETVVEPDGSPHPFRQGVALEGNAPWWVSQHAGQMRETGGRGDQAYKGASSRGMVIREWEAVLGGNPVDRPSVSFFGSQSPVHGLIAEIAPPAGLTRLQKGDYVDMLVEVLLVPKHPQYYLGTNEALKRDLPAVADTWRAIHMQAEGGDVDLKLTRGRLEQAFPPQIRVDPDGMAEFEITGGRGYVPVVFTGVLQPSGVRLYGQTDDGWQLVDQSDHGNDFWQAEHRPDTGDYWITYTLLLDPSGEGRVTRPFRFITEASASPDRL